MAEQTTEATPDAPTRYQVVAEFVNVKTAGNILPGGGQWVVVGLYRNAFLPSDVPIADIERLLRRGFIEEVAA